MVQQSLLTLLALPVLALAAPLTSSVLPRAANGSGQVTFKNNCDYAVSLKPFPGSGCTAGAGGDVEAGSSWTDSVIECAGGNTALKVYKAGEETSPMQFEYGLQGGMLWYDISFIDCVKNGNDFSQCIGSAWEMGSGDSQCTTFKCSAEEGAECCKQGYCDPFADAIDPDPTAGCASSQDITVNLCA